MSYDRYDTRDAPRDQRSRSSDDARSNRDRGGREDRGFFERAGDEIASWFGDDESERRRREGDTRSRRSEERGYERDYARDRSSEPGRDRDWNDNRGAFAQGGSSERDYDRDWRREYAGRDSHPDRADDELDRGWSDRYRPITGDYGRGGRSSGDRDRGFERSQSQWARDEYRGTSRAGSANWSDKSREDFGRSPNEGLNRSREDRFDPHYHSWRDRHLSELDRDYDDYRAEHQSKFESDFGSWRERRQQKRAMLGQAREHMEVVGSDGKHVGTIDKVAGERIILTKSDPESGGVHHSLSCSDLDRIDGDRVVLDCSADRARERWRDESRSRALFERDDQGEAGPRALDRSFEGTYRR